MFLPAALMATAGAAGLRSGASKAKLSFPLAADLSP